MTLKILHKRSTAVTGGVADAPASTDLEYGEIGINYADDDPALYIKDSADDIRRITLSGSGNKKYALANDDAELVGANATAAINAALIAAGDIGSANDLGISDQCQITDSGNADANEHVSEGRYWWDGTNWFEGGGGANVDISDNANAPDNANHGDLWWNTDDGRLYVYYTDADSSQWVDASPDGDLDPGDFLSSVNDDTARGEITFEGLTTHEAGINVTGGGIDGNANTVFRAVRNSDQVNPFTLATNDNIGTSIWSPSAISLYGHTYRQTSGNPAYRFSIETSNVHPTSSNQVACFIKTNFTAEQPTEDGIYANIGITTQAGGTYRGEFSGISVSNLNNGVRNSGASTVYGVKSEVSSIAGKNNPNLWNFYVNGDAASRIPNLQTTFQSFLAISELDQTDSEGNAINWEQPTAATVGTGIYRNAAGALCFARNGECALEIGDGQIIGNLLDKLESIEARLAALEGGTN